VGIHHVPRGRFRNRPSGLELGTLDLERAWVVRRTFRVRLSPIPKDDLMGQVPRAAGRGRLGGRLWSGPGVPLPDASVRAAAGLVPVMEAPTNGTWRTDRALLLDAS
jgi:hypothetical protein